MSLQFTEELHLETCMECGVKFAFTHSHYLELRGCRNTFYCPNGHTQSYSGQTKEEKLQAEVEGLEAANEGLLLDQMAEENSHKATRGHLTRAKKQIAKLKKAKK